ncbi:MAG: CvpA family protein [Brumimicrobium sp.]|nr:CvpA family protein [Brumimicrobium sp.]
MNFVDILILVPLLYGAWVGFKKGLVIEVFTLLALLVGIYAGIHFSDWTAAKIKAGMEIEGKYLPVVAFTVTFLAVGAMVYFGGKMIEKMLKVVQLSLANKFFGALFGILKMVYFMSILIILLETYDERNEFIPSDVKEGSLLYEPVKITASSTIPAIEESSIWLKNNIDKDMIDDAGQTIEDTKRLKETADSLGITVEDLKRLKQEE